jgi:hypothetical protein
MNWWRTYKPRINIGIEGHRMNTDVRIATNYPDHPKTLKLKKMLGAEGVMSHIFLLCFVARVTPSGVLTDMDAKDIAEAAKWRGDPHEFVDTLHELRLLDQNSETYSVHDWQEHNYYCVSSKARSRSARRSAVIGWLIRRNLIPRKSKIPPRLDIDQEPEKIAEQIQTYNANRKAERNALRNAPSPPPRGEGDRGEDPALGEGVSPPVSEMLELFGEMYQGTYIDATKERKFFLLYERATEQEQAEVQKLAELVGVKLPADPYANQ